MPPDSTMKTFLKAVRERRTRTTKVLDQLFASPGQYQGRVPAQRLRPANALNGRGFLAWATNYLQGPGGNNAALVLSEDELNHIADWPDTEKEKVRNALDTAISGRRRVRFFWELYNGTTSVTTVDNLPGPGDIVVTFRSPESRVKSPVGTDEVKVTVP